jgi:hypothetical protein
MSTAYCHEYFVNLSPSVYKELFGESMPRIKPLTMAEIEGSKPAQEAKQGPAPAAGGEPELAEPVDPATITAPKDGPKPKWQMSSCRTCGFRKNDRPDKQKMAPMRLWCSLLRKETSPTKTCPRGKWD